MGMLVAYRGEESATGLRGPEQEHGEIETMVKDTGLWKRWKGIWESRYR